MAGSCGAGSSSPACSPSRWASSQARSSTSSATRRAPSAGSATRRPNAPRLDARLPAVDTIGRRLRMRLLPALLTALGVALLANGLTAFTTAFEDPPLPRALPTYEPLPTFAGTIILPSPGPSAVVTPAPTFPPGRVATRIVIRRLKIDLPIMLPTDNYGLFPLCDVALYPPLLGQPGQGRTTYICAHAREGMFLPLLTASQNNNGRRMLGMTVEIYTSDNWLYLYTITEVRRHTLSLQDAIDNRIERLWMQTSEGPEGTVPKLQVVADFLAAEPTDHESAHPKPRPRICS